MTQLEEMVRNSSVDMEAIFGRPDPRGERATEDMRQRRVMYWRKADHPGATDRGWITTGPHPITNSHGAQRLSNRGWVPLAQYGYEISGHKVDDRSKDSPLNGRTPTIWEATSDQVRRPITWLEPFFRKGGLTAIISTSDGFGTPGTPLIPASQLVALNLHLVPEIVRARPDLADVTVLYCPERCIHEDTGLPRTFSGVTKEEAQGRLDQHMGAKHKASEGTRSVGEQIAAALKDNERLDEAAIARLIAASMLAMEELKEAKNAPPKPTGPKFPNGFPDQTWKRQELMAYAADRNLGKPENHMKADTQTWYNYVVSQIQIPNTEEPLDFSAIIESTGPINP